MLATYEPRHVLVSTTYSKAVLRVAADEAERAHANVCYFPGFEIISGSYSRGAYYQPDLRTVTAEGVKRVMRLFLKHFAAGGARADETEDDGALREARAAMDVICDEDAIGPAAGSAEWDEERVRIAAERHDDRPLPEPAAGGSMEALDPRSMRVALEAAPPGAIRAGSVVTIRCLVANDGDAALATAPPHPVYLCYRWYDARLGEVEVGRSLHTPLPAALEPGASVRVTMAIAAPHDPGRYRLRVSLLQSEVAWFDEVDARNGVETVVEVG
jgi:hypothetical protein